MINFFVNGFWGKTNKAKIGTSKKRSKDKTVNGEKKKKEGWERRKSIEKRFFSIHCLFVWAPRTASGAWSVCWAKHTHTHTHTHSHTYPHTNRMVWNWKKNGNNPTKGSQDWPASKDEEGQTGAKQTMANTVSETVVRENPWLKSFDQFTYLLRLLVSRCAFSFSSGPSDLVPLFQINFDVRLCVTEQMVSSPNWMPALSVRPHHLSSRRKYIQSSEMNLFTLFLPSATATRRRRKARSHLAHTQIDFIGKSLFWDEVLISLSIFESKRSTDWFVLKLCWPFLHPFSLSKLAHTRTTAAFDVWFIVKTDHVRGCVWIAFYSFVCFICQA